MMVMPDYFRMRSRAGNKFGYRQRRNTTSTNVDPLLQHAIFDIPIEKSNAGVQAYFSYINQQMDEWDDFHRPVLEFIPDISDMRISADLATKAILICRRLGHTDLTMDDVVEALFIEYKLEVLLTALQKSAIRQVVFAAIGWATMLYIPVSNRANNEFCILSPLPAGGSMASQVKQNMNISTRPIIAMLRGFDIGRDSRRSESQTPLKPGDKAGMLQTSNLYYSSLWTIGGVSVRWVESLDAHLSFDPVAKVLMLFRFPSFCALQSGNRDDVFLEGLLQSMSRVASEDIVGSQSYVREVLLSFRILFGDDSKSRNLFRTKERCILREYGNYDKGLDDLCGRAAMTSRIRHHCELQVRSSYNSDFDFPHLGARLRRLHEYSVSQNASKLSELWLDRRNLLQWFTFWAVIFVGGISIILSFVQTSLSAAQLALSARGGTCPC